jgi:hypothetical protein
VLWQVNNTVKTFPEEISFVQVTEPVGTTVQKLTCDVLHGVNRVLVVSVNKDSPNTASMLSATVGSNNVALPLSIAAEGVFSSGVYIHFESRDL